LLTGAAKNTRKLKINTNTFKTQHIVVFYRYNSSVRIFKQQGVFGKYNFYFFLTHKHVLHIYKAIKISSPSIKILSKNFLAHASLINSYHLYTK